jgi:NadR type nicotinamide-nucleotide adenylyltransferase
MPPTSSPKPKRIAIVGPESSGKSMLAAQLAAHYKTVWVPEYSRAYLKEIGRNYDYDDILVIAKGQYESELKFLADARGFLFCDTEFLVNMIWCLEKYGQCHPWIVDMHQKHPYDLYLLCKPDLPWEDDPLREAPEEEERNRLFERYEQVLMDQDLPYGIVAGKGKERLKNAVRIIGDKF